METMQTALKQTPMIRRNCFFLSIILGTTMFSTSYAQDKQSVNSFNTFRSYSNANPWLQTGNASGMVFNKLSDVVVFDAGIEKKQDDFHLLMNPEETDRYFLDTKSYQSMDGKFFLFGNFAYNYIDEKGARWNGTYDPYRGNPYILGDSVSGATYHKENYCLSGKLAYKLSDRLSIGTGVEYFVAVAAKQKDPRPSNTVSLFRVNPSLILHGDNSTWGFDLGFNHRKEEIDYEVKRESFDVSFFMFKGFGFYSRKLGSMAYRFQSANEFFGGLQYEKKWNDITSLTEIRGNYSLEGIEDGSSSIKKGDAGEWQTIEFKLNQQLQKTNTNSLHRLSVTASYFEGAGREFLEDEDNSGNVVNYIVIAKNLKMKRQLFVGQFAYDFITFDEEEKSIWDVHADLGLVNQSEKYYYVPETFTSSFMNLNASAKVQRNWYWKKHHFAPEIGIAYLQNLSNSIFLSDLNEITKNQRKDVYTNDINYLTTNIMTISPAIKWGYTPSDWGRINQLNLSMKYCMVNPDGDNGSNSIFQLSMGVVF